MGPGSQGRHSDTISLTLLHRQQIDPLHIWEDSRRVTGASHVRILSVFHF